MRLEMKAGCDRIDARMNRREADVSDVDMDICCIDPMEIDEICRFGPQMSGFIIDDQRIQALLRELS